MCWLNIFWCNIGKVYCIWIDVNPEPLHSGMYFSFCNSKRQFSTTIFFWFLFLPQVSRNLNQLVLFLVYGTSINVECTKRCTNFIGRIDIYFFWIFSVQLVEGPVNQKDHLTNIFGHLRSRRLRDRHSRKLLGVIFLKF